MAAGALGIPASVSNLREASSILLSSFAWRHEAKVSRKRDGGVGCGGGWVTRLGGIARRRGRDLNPRWGVSPYSLSRGAPSATRPPLQKTALLVLWVLRRSASLHQAFLFCACLPSVPGGSRNGAAVVLFCSSALLVRLHFWCSCSCAPSYLCVFSRCSGWWKLLVLWFLCAAVLLGCVRAVLP